MSIDKTNIDVHGIFSQYLALGRRKATTHGGEYSTSCPLCGGRDRFQVWPDRLSDAQGNVTNFWCRRCNQHGDIITFVQLVDQVSFGEACARLDIPYKGNGGGSLHHKKPATPRVNLDEPPSDTWAMAALSFARECQKALWSPIGAETLDYLWARGFSDETIKARGYGFNPLERFDDLDKWDVHEGKKVWLPRGIVIPWVIQGTIWKLSIRQLDKTPKYVAVKGGSNGLYRADRVSPGRPLVIFEGEFNADLLDQALDQVGIEDIAIVATGSTDKGRADNWLVKIAKASPILFSFDPDASGAEAIKEYWGKVLPIGLSWPSIGGDLNDMFLAGKNLLKWLNKGLSIAGSSLVVATPTPAPDTELPAAASEPFVLCPFQYPRQRDGGIDFQRLVGMFPGLLPDDEVPASFKNRPCSRCETVGQAARRCDGVILCPCFWTRYAARTQLDAFRQVSA